MNRHIDTTALRHLMELDEEGTFEIIPRLIQMFSEALPERLRGLRSAVLKGNLRELARTAHAMKSPSSHLGLVRVVELLQRLENGNCELSEMSDMVNQVESEARVGLAALQEQFC